MKQILNVLFLKESNKISTDEFLMKFLRSLAEQINWPAENFDCQIKLNDNTWRNIFIRLLATINCLLTHRVKKFQKDKIHLITNDEENDFDQEKSTISRQLFHENDDEEEIHHQDQNLIQQQHSDFTQLEQELIQPNSIFYSIEKWFENVRRTSNVFLTSIFF